MTKPRLVARRYAKQHYTTLFSTDTGFFARIEDNGYPEPFWSWHGPELLDLSITNWCDRGCDFCYRDSGKNGRSMRLRHYETVIRQAKEMGVLQVALGGGNPNQHPHFPEILRLARSKYGIVPNYTTNGRGLTAVVLEASRAFCGAVAVSAYLPYKETKAAVDALTAYGIRTSIHFILHSTSIDTAIRWLEKPPEFLSKANAIIFLNYKPVGRHPRRELLLKSGDRLAYFFHLATKERHSFKVGFDSCTATGIARYTNVPSICYDGCDAGRFSMFVSEDMRMYPCSFMAETESQGIPIVEDNMQEAWRSSELFEMFRRTLARDGHQEQRARSQHQRGCPVFPEIDL